MRIFIFFFLFGLCATVNAQNKKQSNNKKENSTEAFYPQQEQSPKNSKNKSVKITHDARDKFYARQEGNKKSREKNYARTDYSQAPYFGHKHPPRIRPVGKRKLCKVCGVTH